jgi:hypothetical protein
MEKIEGCYFGLVFFFFLIQFVFYEMEEKIGNVTCLEKELHYNKRE